MSPDRKVLFRVWRLIDALTEAKYSFQQDINFSFTLCYSEKMSGKAKRLSESQRLELVFQLSQANHSTDPSERSIAREYGIRLLSEKSVRSGKLCVNVLL